MPDSRYLPTTLLLFQLTILLCDLNAAPQPIPQPKSVASPDEGERLAIYSLDSTVWLPGGLVRVNSTTSRFEISEQSLNATIHSNSSTARFDETTGRVEMSAAGSVLLELRLDSILMRSVAHELEMKCTTERSNAGQTRVHAALSTAVNLSVVDTASGTEIVARNGRIAGVIAETWSKNISHGLSIVSSLVETAGAPGEGGNATMMREVSIAAFSPSNGVQIRVEQAALSLVYGQSKADISADHRAIRLWSGERRIELYTVSSPLEIFVDPTAGLTVNGYKEEVSVNISPDSGHINIVVQQPSRIEMNRPVDLRLLEDAGERAAGSASGSNASSVLASGPLERVEFISLSVQLMIHSASATKQGSIVISGTQSQLRLTTTNTTISITSARQLMEISGSEQSLLKLRAGNVTLVLSYGGDMEHGGDIVDAGDISFAYEEERLQRIGPFTQGDQNQFLLVQIGDIPSARWVSIQSKGLSNISSVSGELPPRYESATTASEKAADAEKSATTAPPTTASTPPPTGPSIEMEPIVFPTPRDSIMTFPLPGNDGIPAPLTPSNVDRSSQAIEVMSTSTSSSATSVTTVSALITSTAPDQFITPSGQNDSHQAVETAITTASPSSTTPTPTSSTLTASTTLNQFMTTIEHEHNVDADANTLQQHVVTATSSADDFVFGQYETPDTLFPLLATITNVELQTARPMTTIAENSTIRASEDATYASIGHETASIVYKRGTRELRSNGHGNNHTSGSDTEVGAKSDTLFGVDLLLDSRADVHSPEFKSSLEEALGVALTNLLPSNPTTPVPRIKRSSGWTNATMHVRIRQLEVENDEIGGGGENLLAKITFTIDDTNGTRIPTSDELAEISPDKLSNHLPYPAISAISVKRRSPPIHSIASSFAFSIPIGIIILGGSVIVVFSLVIAKMAINDWLKQRTQNYLDRKASAGAGSLIPIAPSASHHDRAAAALCHESQAANAAVTTNTLSLSR